MLKLHSKELLSLGHRYLAGCGLFLWLGLFLRDFYESVDAIAYHFRRNSETQSLCGNTLRRKRHFRRADANQSPGKIDDRSAAVARINCRIRLHQVFVLDI